MVGGNSTLNSTTSPNVRNHDICIILGSTHGFSIDIGKTKTVDHLKDKIKLKQIHKPDGFDANKLELYQIRAKSNFDYCNNNRRFEYFETGIE